MQKWEDMDDSEDMQKGEDMMHEDENEAKGENMTDDDSDDWGGWKRIAEGEDIDHAEDDIDHADEGEDIDHAEDEDSDHAEDDDIDHADESEYIAHLCDTWQEWGEDEEIEQELLQGFESSWVSAGLQQQPRSSSSKKKTIRGSKRRAGMHCKIRSNGTHIV